MKRSDATLRAILAGIALLAVAVPLWVVTRVPRAASRSVLLLPPQRVISTAELPPVEPTRYVAIAPADARVANAELPFADGPNPAARPFRFSGTSDERARATDCLAAAAVFEAGDDATGESAVAQVVLNRLRHPAFPKTVCGVVFQGAERTTGCQFTFACDGALVRRRPSEAGWQHAREVAAAALAGTVYPAVGFATHYHADYVVPYWQASLDKVAAVHGHLFFRWAGWWGTPAAFSRQAQPGEPVIGALAGLSQAHRGAGGVALVDAGSERAAIKQLFFGRSLRPLVNDPNSFLTALDPGQSADAYRAMAMQACEDKPHCKVLGWTDVSAMSFTLPLSPEAQSALSFSYLRDRASGFDKALWNCAEFKRVPASACMKHGRTAHSPASVEGAPVNLAGVRRKSDTAGNEVPGAQ